MCIATTLLLSWWQPWWWPLGVYTLCYYIASLSAVCAAQQSPVLHEPGAMGWALFALPPLATHHTNLPSLFARVEVALCQWKLTWSLASENRGQWEEPASVAQPLWLLRLCIYMHKRNNGETPHIVNIRLCPNGRTQMGVLVFLAPLVSLRVSDAKGYFTSRATTMPVAKVWSTLCYSLALVKCASLATMAFAQPS